MEDTNRRLMWHGMCLFLIGLLTGFAEQHFANIRMGLAAHLEGVMNGTFLVALGAAWTSVRLSPATKGDRILDRALRDLWQLVRNHTRCGFWYVALSPITGASHSGILLEREPGHDWIPNYRYRNRRLLGAHSLGSSRRERSRDLELRKPHAESSHPRVPELLRHGIAPIGPCCHQDFCLFPAFAYYLGGHAAPTELRGPDDFKRNV